MGYLHAVAGIEAAFFAQGQPLLHTETVLFINDGQAKPVKLYRFLKQGMGAHHDLRRAIGQGGIGFPPCLHAQTARQPMDINTQGRQPVTEVVAMLFGQ